MDVYTPHQNLKGTNKVLLFVHGGGMKSLTPDAWRQMRGVGYAFMNDSTDNILVLIPEMEVYPTPLYSRGDTTPPPPVGTPMGYEQPLDIGCAIGWIKQYSYLYGGSKTPQITLVGYSSGAGVAASVVLASTQFLPSPEATLQDITGVLTMSGNYDYKKAEDAEDPFFQWYYIHGEPTSSPDTSPLDQGSPSPAAAISVPWIAEYEECDADDHYSDAERLTYALNQGWNGTGSYLYENMQHYAYSGASAPAYTPSPMTGEAVHGDGQDALALQGSPLYNVAKAMIDGSPPTPLPSPTWEQVPLLGSVTGAKDVAVGPDGTIWIVTTNAASDGNGMVLAKYANKHNVQHHCVTELPTPASSQGADNVSVDGYGDPWISNDTGGVRSLPGGLIAAEPSPTYTGNFANGGGNGLGATLSPVGGPSATDIGAGAGSRSGSATPPVYNNYARAIGSVWITTETPSPHSASDFTLRFYNGSGWTSPSGAPYGQRLAVDAGGDAWIVANGGQIYTTGIFGLCTSGFCSVPSPGAESGAENVGVGDGFKWITSLPNGKLYYLTIDTWNQLTGFVASGPISGTFEGMPVVRKADNTLWIYHSCTWPDGSPAGGNSLQCPHF